MRVKYSSNNSGGSWWLKDKDWKALEKAGWIVEWGGTYFCHSERQFSWDKCSRKLPNICATREECKGHRKFDSADQMQESDRWLGAIAQYAYLDCGSPTEAILSFEKATKCDASNDGCNCCGPPHSFSWGEGKERDYISGEEIATLLYPKAKGLSYRELAAKIK